MKRIDIRIPTGLVIVLICLVCMYMAVLVSGLLTPWDAAATDLFMRWRYKIEENPGELASSEILFVPVDNFTQQKLGGFAGPNWVFRQPYVDQLTFIDDYLKPTVVAYDILFSSSLGIIQNREGRVTESRTNVNMIVAELQKVSDDPAVMMSGTVFPDLTRLMMEQGNGIFAERLAAISSSTSSRKKIACVIGANFLGGDVDPRRNLSPFSADDIYGSSASGDEKEGRRLPYIRDISIPAASIHLPSGGRGSEYSYSVNAATPSQELMENGPLLGFVNGPKDPDGIVRRLPLVIGYTYSNQVTGAIRKEFVPSFSLLCCLIHLGFEFPLKPGDLEVNLGRNIELRTPSRGRVVIPVDERGYMYLNCTVMPVDFRRINFAELSPSTRLSGTEYREKKAKMLRSQVDGKMLIVGVSLTGVDIGGTPLSPVTEMVYTHLIAVNNILRNEFIAPVTQLQRDILYLSLILVLIFVGYFEKPVRLGLTAVLLVLMYLVLAYSAVHYSVVVMPVLCPVLYIMLCSFVVLSYRFITEERAKRKIRGFFSTMVSDKVLSYLEERPESFSLSGKNVEATIFSSDVEEFTKVSEILPPDRLTALLNTYLTPVSNSIVEHGGYIDKYMGDGIMAVWGAPYPDQDHSLKACRSALEQQAIVRGMQNEIQLQYGFRIRVRMGLNAGTVTAGNMGSEKKFQYTVMGDAVNLAFRLEPVNKDFGTDIIIGNAVNRAVSGKLAVRPLGRIVVVGRNEPEPIFELLGEINDIPAKRLEIAGLYAEALECFYRRDWEKCRNVLAGILRIDDDPASRFLDRLAANFRDNPPGEDWRGEYVRAEKL